MSSLALLFLSKTEVVFISSTLDQVIEKFSFEYLEMIVSIFMISRSKYLGIPTLTLSPVQTFRKKPSSRFIKKTELSKRT